MNNRDNFDIFDNDSRNSQFSNSEYRSRQRARMAGYPNGRKPYRKVSSHKKNRRRTRNRIIIVSVGILILGLFVFLLSLIFKGCGSKPVDENSISTTIAQSQAATTAPKQVAATKSSKDQLIDKSYFETPKIEDDGTNGTSSYNVYVWKKAAYELFGSTAQRAQTYAKTINGFQKDFGDSVKVYDMVVPNHTEMGLPQRLKDSDAYSTSQADNIKAAYESLDSAITPINCYNYLAEHNSEYIYFNTDHHWTGLGAYYSYKAFCDTLGKTSLSLKDCTEKTIDGFTGSFSNSATGLQADTVHYWEFPYDVSMQITYADATTGTYDSPYYQYAEAGSNTYGVFIMGDNVATVLKSSSDKAPENSKIAVVKESYGNAFVPYLTYNYKEVHVIDFRYFKENLVDYCKKNNITEVLFLNGVMSANTQIQLDSMSGLFK